MKPFDVELDADDITQIVEEWAMADPKNRTAIVLTYDSANELYRGGAWSFNEDILATLILMAFAKSPTIVKNIADKLTSALNDEDDYNDLNF